MLFYLLFVFCIRGVHHFQALASCCISSIFLLLLVVFYVFVMMENKNTMNTMNGVLADAEMLTDVKFKRPGRQNRVYDAETR